MQLATHSVRALQSVLLLQQLHNYRSKLIQALKLKPYTIHSQVSCITNRRTALLMTAVSRAVFDRMQQEGLRGKLALEGQRN